MSGKRLLWRLLPSYLLAAIGTFAVFEMQRAMNLPMILGVITAVCVAWGASWLASRRIGRELKAVEQGAEQFARGILSRKIPVPASREIGALAETMNRMAGELDHRIQVLVQQQQQHEAILFSMVESVLAVDTEERLISLNQAGARLLRVRVQDIQGRRLQEVVRNPALERLVAHVLATQQSVSEEIVIRLNGGEERVLDAQGTVLLDAGQQAIGALVVLHDITRVRRLEIIRRDFVANVSHELKTPVTSIKGFVETLLDGALKSPGDAERFLKIVAAQADRLTAIIEDLLMLSRIEQGTEKAEIALEPVPIRKVVQAAVDICQLKAAEKDIRVEIRCSEDLAAESNAALLEQALVNLIDNAIKYSPNGASIFVEAEGAPDEILIRVKDHGSGISHEHLSRIFERFYRVDKARSRKLGGTGLGLAIVKHIAQAHGGRATVQSRLGEGSTFCLHLPVSPKVPLEPPPETFADSSAETTE